VANRFFGVFIRDVLLLSEFLPVTGKNFIPRRKTRSQRMKILSLFGKRVLTITK